MPLNEITHDDVIAEGFRDWTVDQFIDFFCRSMRGVPDQVITRIEWRYLEPVAEHDREGHPRLAVHVRRREGAAERHRDRAPPRRPEGHREVSLNPRGRIDFLVQTTAAGRRPRTRLEVKVAGSSESVMRQLQGYAPYVDDRVLVTTKPRYAQLPLLVGEKACRAVPIRGAAW